MGFNKISELTAMAIVHIFEASKPFGEYDAFVVLPDNAGISYGINQFTHRSKSLLAVVEKYIELGGKVEIAHFYRVLPLLKLTTPTAINTVAKDKLFEISLKAAARTPEMQQAQIEVAKYKYFDKAVAACDGSKFVLPMSLAVVYDSINHGSFDRIRDKVLLLRKDFVSDVAFEKAWIKAYCQARLDWLKNYKNKDPKKQAILRKTVYRPEFFLTQIEKSNWNLSPPMRVHGFNLQEKHLIVSENIKVKVSTDSAKTDVATPNNTPSSIAQPDNSVESSADSVNSGKADNSNEWQEGNRPDTSNATAKAPTKEGSTSTAITTTFLGFTVSGTLAVIITTIQQGLSQGFVSAAQIGEILLKFITENTKYFLLLIALIIILLIIKKLCKQITLWLEMYFKASPNFNDVDVKKDD